MTRPMTRFDATPGGRPCRAFRPNDARIEQVASTARFVALRVDATDDDDPEVARVRDKYGAREGLPVVVAFASDGREAFRFTEFVPAERLAAALSEVP